jgi:ankyrin repeat protein
VLPNSLTAAFVNVTHENGNTPLHQACLKGHTDVVQLLLANNADVDVTNANDETPLHAACKHGHTSVVQALLANDAVFEMKNDDGGTELRHSNICVICEEFFNNIRMTL